MATLIPKNTTIPTEASQLVSTVQENQSTVRFIFFRARADAVTMFLWASSNFTASNPAHGTSHASRFDLPSTAPGLWWSAHRTIVRACRPNRNRFTHWNVSIRMKKSSRSVIETDQGLVDDINIQLSSGSQTHKGDSMDAAIVESIKRTIEKAKVDRQSNDESTLRAALQTLRPRCTVFRVGDFLTRKEKALAGRAFLCTNSGHSSSWLFFFFCLFSLFLAFLAKYFSLAFRPWPALSR